jgi:hypothetical protein
MTIWHTRIACWISKDTITVSEYTSMFRFSTATLVARKLRNITFYEHYLSCYFALYLLCILLFVIRE